MTNDTTFMGVTPAKVRWLDGGDLRLNLSLRLSYGARSGCTNEKSKEQRSEVYSTDTLVRWRQNTKQNKSLLW